MYRRVGAIHKGRKWVTEFLFVPKEGHGHNDMVFIEWVSSVVWREALRRVYFLLKGEL